MTEKIETHIDRIEEAVTFIAEAYGARAPRLGTRLRKKAMKSPGTSILAKVCDNKARTLVEYAFDLEHILEDMPGLVPFRKGLEIRRTKCALTLGEAPNLVSVESSGRKTPLKGFGKSSSAGGDVIVATGYAISASPLLRAQGVVVSAASCNGKGRLRSGTVFRYLDQWVYDRTPEAGDQVSFLPVASEGRRLEARCVRVQEPVSLPIT